jgi:hypothetical protein
MFDTKKSKLALRAAALGLAVAGTLALPNAAAQQAAPADAQDSAVVVKDAVTGKLRAATAQEHNDLKASGAAKKQMLRAAPQPTRQKYHRSGAAGARLTDEFMTSATVVRAADGTLVHECVDAAGNANHAPHAASPAPTTVTE